MDDFFENIVLSIYLIQNFSTILVTEMFILRKIILKMDVFKYKINVILDLVFITLGPFKKNYLFQKMNVNH